MMMISARYGLIPKRKQNVKHIKIMVMNGFMFTKKISERKF